jgi:ferredoxin-type protein NapH
MTIGMLVVVGALAGSLFCSWACPFGLLQNLGAKIPVRKFELPRWTGHFRFVVLGLTVLAIPYLFGEEHPLFVCRICPAGASRRPSRTWSNRPRPANKSSGRAQSS